MIFYRITVDNSILPGGVGGDYAATLAEAHTLAKSYSAAVREYIRIEEISVPTDKDGVLALLKGPTEDFAPLSTWGLAPRGGLRVLPVGE